MKRADFLKKLITSVAVGALPLSLTKDFRKIYLLQCFVAGFRHYEGMNLMAQMKEGDLLELVREPENKYDANAISLHWQGKKIGFIPAAINEMLRLLLDTDALSLFAVITHLEKDSKPWENVAVAVYFIQEANKELPAHANDLTLIEAPHYHTLKNKKQPIQEPKKLTLNDLFKYKKRVINLDTIPAHQKDAKYFYEKHYSQFGVAIYKDGRYVEVSDMGIFTYVKEIDEKIEWIRDANGVDYLEFFLV